MQSTSFYISIAMILTTLFTIFIFYRAAHRSKKVLLISVGWLAVQAALALSGFYEEMNTVPPRFVLLAGPPLLGILALFFTRKGMAFIDRLDARWLTLLHSVRIAVEIILWQLYLQGSVPKIMTFEGRNFDILAGLSALLIFYFAFVKKNIIRNIWLIWNIVCLALLVNIVVIAILSAPTALQQWGFEQPNIAIFHYPFVWLPCCIVPLVLFSHLVLIRRLIIIKNEML